MNILIIGGTIFVGRALVEAALPRGHRLTLFNRGKTNPGLFAEAEFSAAVETINGDRASDLALLQGRYWDAVIDTCGYVPRIVRQSAQALAESVGHYTFVSSISVYADTSQPGVTEDAPVGKLADESVEKVDGETYGPLKALCEQAVEAEFPGRTLIIRPGLIVGPYDRSDRFTYWPARLARGGEVLAPGRPERGIQFIDVRDMAEWIIRLIEQKQTGIYNADGQPETVNMEQLLLACRDAAACDAHFTWVEDAFLLEQNVGPWMELPLWIPENDPQAGGFFAVSVEKATRSGLTYRPLAEIVQSTLAWAQTRPADHEWSAGMKAEREAEVLLAWKQKTS